MASPARIASRVFGMTEQHLRAVRDAVDRALAARRELHHEQVGAALVRQQLERLVEPHRDGAGSLVEQLVRAVDGRVEHTKSPRAGGEDRLEADRRGRGSRARSAAASTCAPPLTRRKAGCRDPDPVEQGVGLRLVVGAVDRVRAARRAPAPERSPGVPRDPQGRTRTAAARSRRARARRRTASPRGSPRPIRAGRDGTRRRGAVRPPAPTCPCRPAAPRARRSSAAPAAARPCRGHPTLRRER